MEIITFNYPRGDEAAKRRAENNANRIRGSLAHARARDPDTFWPAVEQTQTGDRVMADQARVERNDNIGMLARRLIGGEDTPPDFTAAPPLFDALLEEDRQLAYSFQSMVFRMAVWFDESDPNDQRARENMISSIQNELFSALSPALFDFTAACGHLAVQVEAATKPQEVETATVQLDTVRMWVPDHAGIGARVLRPDGRDGVVVSARNSSGFADVIPTGDDGATLGEGSPPSMSSRYVPGFATMNRPVGRGRRFA